MLMENLACAVSEMDTVIVNRPPNRLSKPVFKTIIPGVEYIYETSSSDPDGD